MIDCPMLIAQIREKRVVQPTPTQNIQMMRSKPCEEDPNMTMMLRSGTTIGEIKRNDLNKICGFIRPIQRNLSST